MQGDYEVKTSQEYMAVIFFKMEKIILTRDQEVATHV